MYYFSSFSHWDEWSSRQTILHVVFCYFKIDFQLITAYSNVWCFIHPGIWYIIYRKQTKNICLAKQKVHISVVCLHSLYRIAPKQPYTVGNLYLHGVVSLTLLLYFTWWVYESPLDWLALILAWIINYVIITCEMKSLIHTEKLRMDKSFHPIFFWTCNHFSTLGFSIEANPW